MSLFHKTDDSSALMNNPKYRQYVTAVDKALKAFEYTTEWADLIAALGKLIKVFQSNAKFGDIPKPVTVSKRLSQCLHPALPSGVHLKTLETYRQIFDLLGQDGLATAMYLYAFGLFPLMSFGGIKVKIELFNIFEKYFVPLGAALRPALVGFLTGLLPGMEEGSEFFDRTTQLLKDIEHSCGADYFFACLWQCVLSSPNVRLAALTYVSSRYDRRKAMDDQLFIMGNSVDRMVSALCEAANDCSLLVQRYLLDVLCNAFALSSEHLVRGDFVRLLQRCMYVVLKRDMSLNRRLYAWLVGCEAKTGEQLNTDATSYFRQHSLPLLRAAVAQQLKEAAKMNLQSRMSIVVRLCRLLLYLLDKPELGQPILEATFMDILEFSAQLAPMPRQLTSSRRRPASIEAIENRSPPSDEHTKTLNLLLNSLDPGFIWRYIGDRYEHSLNSRNMTLISGPLSQSLRYCLSAVQLDSHSDIRRRHLPKLFGKLLDGLERHFGEFGCVDLETILADCWEILLEIQQAAGRVEVGGTETQLFAQESEDSPRDGENSQSESNCALVDDKGEQIVGTEGQASIMRCVCRYEKVLEKVTDWFLSDDHSTTVIGKRTVIYYACSLLKEFADFPLYCLPDDNTQERLRADSSLPPWLAGVGRVSLGRRDGVSSDFESQTHAMNTIIYLAVLSQSVLEQHNAFQSRNNSDPNRKHSDAKQCTAVLLRPFLDQNALLNLEKKGFYKKSAKQLWAHLGDDFAEFHETAARLFCLLHSRNQGEASSVCEDLCVRDMNSKDQLIRSDAAEKFRRLWVLSRNYGTEELYPGLPLKPFNRALLVMLANVTQADTAGTDLAQISCRAWIRDCAEHGDLPRIMQLLLLIVLSPRTARVSVQYVSAISDSAPVWSLPTVDGLTLYHVTGTHDADWMNEWRRRLLAQTDGESERPRNISLPAARGSFDEELSTPSSIPVPVEPVIYELVHDLLDRVCGPEVGVEAHGVLEPVETLWEQQVGRSLSQLSRTASAQDGIISADGSELRFFDSALDTTSSPTGAENSSSVFHPLHAHFLLYTEPGRDTNLSQADHVFRGLALLLRDSRHSAVAAMLTSSLTSTSTSTLPKSTGSLNVKLTDLVAKHVRSILGQDFWNEPDQTPKPKQYMLLELLVTVSLYYLRSYHLNSPTAAVNNEDIERNWKTKISCLEFLTSLCGELRRAVIENGGRAFSSFVHDLLNKCKLQKCLLHCLMVCVHQHPNDSEQGAPLTADIAHFNALECSELQIVYESSLLDLVSEVVSLEHHIKHTVTTGEVNSVDRLGLNQQISAVYARDHWSSLSELRLFLLTALNALKRRFDTHEMWLRFVLRSMPFLERSLASLSLHVTEQLCRNLELAVQSCYSAAEERKESPEILPTNYVCMVLNALTSIFHYSVVDSSQSVSLSSQTSNDSGTSQGRGPVDLFSNLVKVFSFSDSSQTPSSPAKSDRSLNYVAQARTELLGAFPHALSTLCQLWSAIKHNQKPTVAVGTPQQVRRLILDLLSPIALNHPTNFLSSLALVWLTREQKDKNSDQLITDYTSSQMDMCDLVLSIKMLPLESLLVAVLSTLKEPAKVKNITEKDMFPTEVSLLELLHGCLRSSPLALLRSCWPAVQQLLTDALTLSLPPRATFLLFQMFTDYVRVCCGSVSDEKSVLRQMQDVCQKLTEAVSSVVSWQLQQTTWLKRTLVVKQDLDGGFPSTDLSPRSEFSSTLINGKISPSASMTASTISLPAQPTENKKRRASSSNLNSKDTNNNRRDATLSTKALCLLAENLANMIDSICKSEDKEKLLPALYAVWANALPYLKARSAKNAKNFLASSKLLASLTGYSYTRQVWRKATLDLLIDSNFFRMDVPSLKQWLTIVDNLTTHDKTTFKDLLGRLNASQLPGLAFITSKEQEYELRSAALKRLAFVLLSSELDQYQPQMPEIQERLTENLRLYQVPHVHAHVFLCYRVLLIRLSPQHLVSLWPSIISELVQVLMQIEQDLTLGSATANDDLKMAREDQWMQLYLAAVKLLDSLSSLPSECLNQFQMYEWAFVTSVNSDSRRRAEELFVPHVTRICKLMTAKFGKLTPYQKQHESELIQIKSISTLQRLHSYFHHLSYLKTLVRSDTRYASLDSATKHLESALYVDFLDSWI